MYDKFYDVVLPQQEVWKDVKGFCGVFQVSNYGNVKSLDRVRTWVRKGSTKTTSRLFKGKVLTNKVKSTGYEEVHLRNCDQNVYRAVHRLVAEAFKPNADGLPVVDHKDDNKLNNYAWNLQWCTVQFNTKKAEQSGLLKCGDAAYKRRLPPEIKEEVRVCLSKGHSIRSIEVQLGISQRSIGRIRDGVI